MLTIPDTAPAEVASTLRRNLEAIGRCDPAFAEQITRVSARPDVSFVETGDEGAPSATVDGRALASRRRPLEEAKRLSETVDVRKAGVVVVLGFGLGHHVGALARRLGGHGMLIVFEPDLELLRSVLERVDHSAWLAQTNIRFFSDPSDGAALSSATKGAEGLVALGARIVEHPPSAARLGESGQTFSDTFSQLVAATRTVVVTTMVQSEVTVRNLVMNLDRYARLGAGVDDLEDSCAGRPAIIVSAGPSLHRNIELLKRPGVRERCVIIAVQTTLKTLLAHGIRPHYVTALDYHEISRRFYEGLSEADVEDVTLIAEPKANAAILDAFPGAIRCPGDQTADMILGEDLACAHGSLPEGATVAHLAYYFARHLGCDPVAFIGQDLGFTDGQYYGRDAAIHDVWAPELNPFNTLEMMEWQRIVRSRHTLRKATDHLGRPIYTDEQMHTYLSQFERDFRADREQKRRVYDATEGGVAKRGADPIRLADFLDRFAGEHAPLLPATAEPTEVLSDKRRRRLEDRLRSLRQDVRRIAAASRETESILQEMSESQDDRALVNRLIGRVNTLRDEVQSLQPAFALVQRINQTGGFRRVRSDREIALEESLTPKERQRRQIERDLDNVRWVGDAADSLAELLESGLKAAQGGAKLTRDPAPVDGEQAIDGTPTPAGRRRSTSRVAAVIPVSDQGGGLSGAFMGRPALQATLERLSGCTRLDRAILLTSDAARTEKAIDRSALRLDVEIVETAGDPLGGRREAIESALASAPDSWRGAPGHISAYDALLAPKPAASALEASDLDGALLVGPDWPLVDPALCDEVIERFSEHAEERRIVFTQAPPGLAGCIVARSLLNEFARAHGRQSPFATIGAALGYIPSRPASDPIAQPVCVQINPSVRDLGVSAIVDSQASLRRIVDHLRRAGLERWESVRGISAEELARAIGSQVGEAVEAGPQQLLVEIEPPIRSDGLRARWFGLDLDAPKRQRMDARMFSSIMRQATDLRDDVALTLTGPGAGAGEPLAHPEIGAILEAGCRAHGLHLRTDLASERAPLDLILGAKPDIVSVDIHARSPERYREIAGRDGYERVLASIDALLRGRARSGGLALPWIVPRLTRCDAVYEEIEPFFDRWLMIAGSAVIDQAPRALAGDRIQPLGKPRLAAHRDARTRMRVLSDGTVVGDERDVFGRAPIGDLRSESLEDVWRRLQECRRAADRIDDPVLWTGW